MSEISDGRPKIKQEKGRKGRKREELASVSPFLRFSVVRAAGA